MAPVRRALFLAGALALAALTAFVVAAPSTAAKPKPKRGTELTIAFNNTGSNFRGRVKSANVCEASRKVTLFEDPMDGAPERIDSTSSANAGGRYAFEMTWPVLTSEYFTKAPRSKAGGVICKAGRSEPFVFTQWR